MTDRELLELAAKAAGIECDWSGDYFGDGNSVWNPLTDDGDALRLAVSLYIDLRINNGASESVWIDEEISETHSIEVPCDEYYEGISAKYEATRRAIVRAAAEIGKAMP